MLIIPDRPNIIYDHQPTQAITPTETTHPHSFPNQFQVQITTSTRRRLLLNAHRQRLLHGAARCQRRDAHHSDNGVIPQRLSETRVGATTYARSYATVATTTAMRTGRMRTSTSNSRAPRITAFAHEHRQRPTASTRITNQQGEGEALY